MLTTTLQGAARVVAVVRGGRHRSQALAAYASFLSAVRSELRAGSMPGDAVAAASSASGVPCVNPHFGNPFSERDPGDPVLTRARACCAAAWEVHHSHGVALEPLIAVAEQLLRREQELRTLVQEETASARASSRMLMFLPLMGPAFGYAMGCDPWGWLFGTRFGLLDLAAGCSLFAAHAGTTRWIVTRATR